MNQPTKTNSRQSDVFQADVETFNILTEDVSAEYRLVTRTVTGHSGTQEFLSIVLASEAPEAGTRTLDSVGKVGSNQVEVTTVEAVDTVITRTTKQRLENGVVVSSFSSESNG